MRMIKPCYITPPKNNVYSWAIVWHELEPLAFIFVCEDDICVVGKDTTFDKVYKIYEDAFLNALVSASQANLETERRVKVVGDYDVEFIGYLDEPDIPLRVDIAYKNTEDKLFLLHLTNRVLIYKRGNWQEEEAYVVLKVIYNTPEEG
ncbi:MAG: hypothetical protein ACK42C_00075 [Aquificaceae bacterium]